VRRPDWGTLDLLPFQDSHRILGIVFATVSFEMPNHHIVGSGEVEKGYDSAQYGYDKHTTTTEQPFVHGAATVGEATGRGGDTHRGLKSRHIQFLYAIAVSNAFSETTNVNPEPLVVLLEQVSSSGPVRSSLWSVLHHFSWLISP